MTLLIETFNAYPAWQWLLASLCIMAATCVQYGLGIAFGLVAGPLLALINIEFVPAPVLLLTCATATTAALSERAGIKWDQIGYAISGRFLGAVIAILVLGMIPGEKAFMLLFGITIALAVIVSISGFALPFTLPVIGAAGTISGFTATITGVGGPPMAVVYQHQKSSEVRSTLQTFFAIGSMLSFCMLLATDHINFRSVIITAILFPAFLLGYKIAPLARPLFDRNFRKLLLATAALSAVMLIYRGLS